MRILKDNIEELILKTGYKFKEEEYCNLDDLELKNLFVYACFFEENETEIQKITGESLDSILYSKYYWWFNFMKKNEVLFGFDAGIEQKSFKIIDEIDQRLGDVIDLKILQEIEEGKI